jgi:hypothetical protein
MNFKGVCAICVDIACVCLLQPLIFMSSPETEHVNSTSYTLETETFRCQGNSHGVYSETAH